MEAGNYDEKFAKALVGDIKNVQRIFRRLDDGTIFPADPLKGGNNAVADLDDDFRGRLAIVQTLFFPGQGITGLGALVAEAAGCDCIFGWLANPNIEAGGGFKGVVLLWWKCLPIAEVVGFLVPDGIANLIPGEYSPDASDGSIHRASKTIFFPLTVVMSTSARSHCSAVISGTQSSESW